MVVLNFISYGIIKGLCDCGLWTIDCGLFIADFLITHSRIIFGNINPFIVSDEQIDVLRMHHTARPISFE